MIDAEVSAESAMDWNLLLVASSPDGAERTLQFLSGALSACGAWMLSRTLGPEGCEPAEACCVELDFEFPRTASVEIYAVLVACGLTLSREAHLQLTELCHCTGYLLQSHGSDIVRLRLTAYTNFVGEFHEVEGDDPQRRRAA